MEMSLVPMCVWQADNDGTQSTGRGEKIRFGHNAGYSG